MGCLSVVVFDKVVRIFRVIQALVLRLLRLQFYIVIKTLSVIAWLVGFLDLLAL